MVLVDRVSFLGLYKVVYERERPRDGQSGHSVETDLETEAAQTRP